ncbi:MAG: hypothetical protein BWY44_01022 [Candidatus Omnitrophica bacterium ADurb.Bin292]|jgi:hypothetical protein|nr:MAG: hypothetical protein BWY44_01022 [Candidatus Omnitrophica bacterium ADurb.Bin292]HPW76556.1 LPS assembly lipoprotein LptE [Candidatus Omnitrophota bacterium]HQB11501.1 LPS assembly lipoprotein LptE [Candidatus Omnitrophota bacterium]
MTFAKRFIWIFLAGVIIVPLFGGCGYTTKTVLPRDIKTIYVETVKNKIPILEMRSYQQGLEMDITNAVIARLQIDGNLRVAPEGQADSILQMDLKRYEQEGLRFTQLESVEEYRMFIVMHLRLVDAKTNEIIWEEPDFSGAREYYVTDIKQIGEQAAVEQAVDKLAKNIVDRIVEDW